MSMNFGFTILDARICPSHQGMGLEDFRFWIDDLLDPQGTGHEPKISFNPKSKI